MNTSTSQPIQAVSTRIKTTMGTMLKDIGTLPEELMSDLETNHIKTAGPMIFVYRNCSCDTNAPFDLEIAQPVAPGQSYQGKYEASCLEPFTYLERRFSGSLEKLGAEGYEPFIADIQKAGFTLSDQCREVYTAFQGYDSADNITEIQLGVMA